MSFNVDEIHLDRFPKAWRGYARAAVDEVVARLSDAVEELQDRVVRLEAERGDEHGRFEHELEASSAARAELERRMQQATAEREQLASAVEEATREREDVVAAIEEVKSEREARAAYTERLEQELGRYRELEQSLTGAIVAAERSGNDTRAHADREAALIVEQARADARRIVFETSSKRERLVADIQRIRAMLAAAQAALDEQPYATGAETPSHRPVDVDETSLESQG